MRVELRCCALFCLSMAGWFVSSPLSAQVIYLPLPAQELFKQRAFEIHCVVNLKQIVSAAQLWSLDNANQFPPDLQAFALDLGDPSLLVCPADLSYVASTNWASLDWSRVSYEWVPQANWSDATNICCRCKIHNNIAWAEGSVHQMGGYHAGWPEILAGPLSQFVSPGSEARFQVKVAPDASGPLSFQWRRNTLYYRTNVLSEPDPDNAGQLLWFTNRVAQFKVTLLDDQTNQECVLTSVSTNDSDFYSVAVSNSLGTAVSAETGLRVTNSVAAIEADPQWAIILCARNLKQVGALVNWMNRDPLPGNLDEMTNRFGEPLFGWPVALHCPADTNWSPTMSWTDVDLTNTSYQMVPNDPFNPQAVYCRCKVHGFYLQADGQVMWRPFVTSVDASNDTLIRITLRTFYGRPNILEASSDLKDWKQLANYGSQAGVFVYSESRQNSPRFYRLRLP